MDLVGKHHGLLRVAVISTSTEELRRVTGPDHSRYDMAVIRAAERELRRRGHSAAGEGCGAAGRKAGAVKQAT